MGVVGDVEGEGVGGVKGRWGMVVQMLKPKRGEKVLE